MCVWRGTSRIKEIQRQYPTGLHVEKETKFQIYQGLNDGECEIALDAMQSIKSRENKAEYNPNCNLQLVGREVTITKLSFGLKADEKLCSSLFRKVLDYYLLEMSIDNTLDRIMEDAQNVKNNEWNSNDNEVDNGQITAKDLRASFVFYAVLLLFSVILSIILQGKHSKSLLTTRYICEKLEPFYAKWKGCKHDEAEETAKEDEYCEILIEESVLQKMMVDFCTNVKNELREELDNAVVLAT